MAEGYAPSRDQMALIVKAVRQLIEVADVCLACIGRPLLDAGMASYHAALALYSIERALNPARYPLRDRRRSPEVRGWSAPTEVAIHSLLGASAELLTRHGMAGLTLAHCYECWLDVGGRLPDLITLRPEELDDFRKLAGWLPSVESLPSDGPGFAESTEGFLRTTVPRERERPSEGRSTPPQPIELFGPKLTPEIHGEKASRRLTPQEHALVAALKAATERGLSTEELCATLPHAVTVLLGLLNSGDPWGKVILPWDDGGGYRIVSTPGNDSSVNAIDENPPPLPLAEQDVPRYFAASKRAVARAWTGNRDHSDTRLLDALEAEGVLVKRAIPSKKHRTAFDFPNVHNRTRVIRGLQDAKEQFHAIDAMPPRMHENAGICTRTA